MTRWLKIVPALAVAALLVLAAACNGNDDTPDTPPPETPTPTPTAEPTPTSEVPPCLEDDDFVETGPIGTFGEFDGDARLVDALRWEPHDGCERLVIDLADADGEPADRTGVVDAEFLRHLGVVRVHLDEDFLLRPLDHEATGQLFEGELAHAAYTVWSLAGTAYVDVHLADAALARVLVLESPARVVVDLQPGGEAVPPPPAADDNIVLMEPRPGDAEYPLLVTGYARTFEGSVLARIRTNAEPDVDANTTAAAWEETWGEFSLEITTGPVGEAELFVGELSEVRGIEEGVFIDLVLDLPAGFSVLPCSDPLVPVDKERRLPSDCAPPDLVAIDADFALGEELLRSEAARAVEQMLSDAASAGHTLVVRSGYRSFETQRQTFNYWVEQLGEEEAQRVSARPGHSEHQLGTAADITGPEVDWELDQAFAETPGGRWLRDNAWRYGFVLSYPENAEAVTGYIFEPWHYRYVGVDHAQAIVEGDYIPGQYLLDRWLEEEALTSGS